jgi:hypothetical protein
MHVRSIGVTHRLATMSLVALLHCNSAKVPASPPMAEPGPGTSESVFPSTGSDEVLCGGRPRCALAARQAINGQPGVELWTLRLTDGDDTPADGERCNRREYWLVRPRENVLLSADCDAQWGADSQGPAELQLAAGRLMIRYIEFQANDNCEVVDAVINLSSVTIERNDRQEGTVIQDRCQGRTPSSAPLPPPGDGTPNRPLLVLHQP